MHPDISFAVSVYLLMQAFLSPTNVHVQAAYRCLTYLAGTSLYGITIGGPLSNELLAFSDRKSMGGFIIFFN